MAKSKTAIAAVALGIAGVLAVGYVGASVWRNSWNPSKWVKPATETIRPAPDIVDDESHGNVIISDDDESHGISLMSARIAVEDYAAYGVSPQADTAFTITATVKDTAGSTDGIPQTIEELTAEWENASSTWANGKDIADYFTIERVSENSFTVMCLEKFGEPVLLKAKAAGTDVYGTKRCNYLKNLQSVNFTLKQTAINISGFPFEATISPVFGTGTVMGEVQYDTVSLEFISNFTNLMINSSYYNYFEQQCSAAGLTYNWQGNFNVACSEALSKKDGLNKDYDITVSWEEMFNAGMSNVTALKAATNNCEYFQYAIEYAAQNNSAPLDFKICINYRYNYNGKTYSTGTTFKEGTSLVHGQFSLPQISSVEYDIDDDLTFYIEQ